MINQQDFELVTSEAYTHAAAFLEEYQRDSAAFFENPETAVCNIIKFAYGLCELNVTTLKQLPKKGFASWLCRTGSKAYGIAIDTKQLEDWEGEEGIPVNVQKIRSTLHELGHFQLSTRLLNIKVTEKFAKSATPEEEEKAWVYAVTFLSLLLGDYSRKARRFIPDRDDAPKHFI